MIATTIDQLQATVELRPSSTWQLVDTEGHAREFVIGSDIVGFDQGAELLAATLTRLAALQPALVLEAGELSFTTTIPRQVGLAGSSAIIIAALRTLAHRSGHQWEPAWLARTALEVETRVLGWQAGPQDRVVQAMGGLVDMDFATAWNSTAYQPLDAAVLPPLFVAWDRATGAPSHAVHSDVRQRWVAGDSAVVAAMRRFAQLARRGRNALDAGCSASVWPGLLDEAFDLRATFWDIRARDQELVDIGRALGAGVAFAGSGGAVVGAGHRSRRACCA